MNKVSLKNENQIINFIKYVPIIFVLLFGIVLSFSLYVNSKKTFENEKEALTKSYTQQKKLDIKEKVIHIENYLISEQKNTEKSLKSSIKEYVYTAHSLMKSIYEKNYKTKTKQEITQIIKDTLQDIKFNDGRSYFFIYDMDATNIFHPTKPQREGKNYFYDKDIMGTYRNQIAIKIVKEKGEGFFNWFFNKPNDIKKEYEKIGFVKHFKPYDWFVGTGEYVDEFNSIKQKHVINYLNNLKDNSTSEMTIFSEDGTFLTNIDKSKIGTNIHNSKKLDNAESFFKEAKKILNNGGGYIKVSTKGDKTSSFKTKKQTIYIKLFKDWKWIITCVYYEDDLIKEISKKKNKIEADFTKRIKRIVGITLLITSILLVILLFISNILGKKFNKYRQTINERIEENEMQKEILLRSQAAAKMGNWELNFDTMKACWSKQMIKIFGLEDIEFTPGPEFLKSIMFKEDVSCFITSIDDIEKNGNKHQCNYRITKPDGDVIWIECIGTLDKKTNTMVGTIQDITQIKSKDEMLINQSRHAAMGEMISMIAHQWRQPLSIISMDANNMLLDIALDNFNKEKAEQFSNNIIKRTAYLSKTIDDFRNFFKPDKSISKVKVPLVIEEVKSMLQDTLKSNSIEFNCSYESDSEIDSYQTELMQVFVNIINNAKDVLLAKKTEHALINVNVYEDEKFVNIEICDNGGGIDKTILPKIFDPYFSTKDEKTGTGIGLYMSKMIIEEHLHGEIKAYNTKDGACFRISMPKI
ncbi:MAG: two-component system NtrC family sensor kinase [Sulfurimonas sp.]|jgi:two-component system NtrC family sensor kinase